MQNPGFGRRKARFRARGRLDSEGLHEKPCKLYETSGQRVACLYADEMKTKDIAIQRIAKRQHGAVSRLQVQRLGFTRSQIGGRVQSGEWVRELPGVWRLSWADPTPMQKVWCASLWGGREVFVTHRTAAWLWELEDIQPERIELSSSHELRTSVRWLLPHQVATIPKQMQRTRNGVALTSPARTLVDLAAIVDEESLQRAVEHAFRRRIASVEELRRVLRWMPTRGKAGTGTMARLLERGIWNADTQSELERQALALFRRFGLPTPKCQYCVLEGDRSLGTVDFAWPRAKVIVEAEGFQFHSGREAWESDIARYNALVLRGWRVVRLTQADLLDEAATVAKALANCLGAQVSRRGRSAASINAAA